MGANAPAQLSTARCFEGNFIPSLLLAQETKEVLLQAGSVKFSDLGINTKKANSQKNTEGKHMRKNTLFVRQLRPLALLLGGTLLPTKKRFEEEYPSV